MTLTEFESLEVDSTFRGFFERGWLGNKMVKFYKSGDDTVTLTTGETYHYSEVRLSVKQKVKPAPYHRNSLSTVTSAPLARPKHQSEFRFFAAIEVKAMQEKLAAAKKSESKPRRLTILKRARWKHPVTASKV